MHVYVGIFLIAFSTLTLEITLVRLLSVVTWYHLAFFAISTAMLGMTAGATRVYLGAHPGGLREVERLSAIACTGYGIVVPVSLFVLCRVPMDIQTATINPLIFAMATIACALPFYFSGIGITLVLTRHALPVGRLYASDLTGAALGCLFVLGGLEVLDAPNLILVCGALGSLAALCFGFREQGVRRAGYAVVFLALVGGTIVNVVSGHGLRLVFVKGGAQTAEQHQIERWNSFSRVVMYKKKTAPPHYWGPSPSAPQDEVEQYYLNIDGDEGTSMRRFHQLSDIEHLKYDVVNVGYYLQRQGPACVIGVGGGRDVQSAVLFGHDRVVAVEINPIFIDLLKNEFSEFAGLAHREDVELVVDDARSYLSTTTERFSVIQMSLIDTWAATGAGAFSLTENALYTTEAWNMFLGRLTEDGLFTVSRWHNPDNVGESGRAVALAVAALLEAKVEKPSRHIAMITADRVSTLLISRKPFSEQDIERLNEVGHTLGYDIVHLPGHLPEDTDLRGLLSAHTMEELREAASGKTLNYLPATDERPYFFNMLKLNNLDLAMRSEGGVLRGNLVATLTLLVLLACLVVGTILTIVVPLTLRSRKIGKPVANRSVFVSGALYFSLIGASFMFVEIALIQKLSVFLGHPIYALGILLFTIILSMGIGSWLAELLPMTRRWWLAGFPLITAAAILAESAILKIVLAEMMTYPLGTKIMVAVLLLSPLGVFLGFFFPVGMNLASKSVGTDTPWFWALNGIFGVLSSALAVFISIYASISLNLYLASAGYACCVFFLIRLDRAAVTWTAPEGITTGISDT